MKIIKITNQKDLEKYQEAVGEMTESSKERTKALLEMVDGGDGEQVALLIPMDTHIKRTRKKVKKISKRLVKVGIEEEVAVILYKPKQEEKFESNVPAEIKEAGGIKYLFGVI